MLSVLIEPSFYREVGHCNWLQIHLERLDASLLHLHVHILDALTSSEEFIPLAYGRTRSEIIDLVRGRV